MKVEVTRTTKNVEDLVEDMARFTVFVATCAAVLGFVLGVASTIAWFDIDIRATDAVGEGE